MTRYRASYIVFPAATLAAGLAIGFLNLPGDWYAQLRKPSFNPPDWIFGPVWSVLYLMIGAAAARLWTACPSGAAMRLWWLQMALNLFWSPLFFRMHRPHFALVDIVGLLSAILAFVIFAWREDRVGALLFLPYAAWVSFATVLNGAILLLNGETYWSSLSDP
ncbi:MAG: tryptophan-rich sensory protein [Alphaproteobacteria bacterium]|nr:tryptophan-rich sensory protein [Alphaproteobacteria bacterium]MBV9062884.1 tryptophan-rich sensory protein [Alphaproteobacteria bacterium]